MALFRRNRSSDALSFEQRQGLPGIADFDMRGEEGWYFISRKKTRDEWVAWAMAEIRAENPGESWSAPQLEERRTALGEAWDQFHAIGDEIATTGVRVPPGQLLISCLMSHRGNMALAADWPQASPENYARGVVKPDSDAEFHVESVQAWRDEFQEGTSISAYFLMHHRATGRTQERMSCGYFPHGSSHILEFAFITPAVGANGDDFPMQVREMMSTVTVTLAR